MNTHQFERVLQKIEVSSPNRELAHMREVTIPCRTPRIIGYKLPITSANLTGSPPNSAHLQLIRTKASSRPERNCRIPGSQPGV